MSETSLRGWAIKNEIWKPESWKPFLENDLIPFYKDVLALSDFYKNFLQNKILKYSSLEDIEDEKLKNKMRVAIYGGVKPNGDYNKSFAKFMYDTFGISANGAAPFEESIKQYEQFGDSVKITLNLDSWISKTVPGTGYSYFYFLENTLNSLIAKISKDLGIQDYDQKNLQPLNVKIEDFLPQKNEKPEKLISFINDVKKKALNLSIGINPYTTFIFYTRTIPLPTLKKFLECNIENIKRLAEFLGLKPFSMIDLNIVEFPNHYIDNVFFMLDFLGLGSSVLSLQLPVFSRQLVGYLEWVEPKVKKVFEDLIEKAKDQIDLTFEPWKNEYKGIFEAISSELIATNSFYIYIENGRISKIGNKELKISERPSFMDFLIKISPLISAGLINVENINSYAKYVELKFHEKSKDWIKKVIKNEGKS